MYTQVIPDMWTGCIDCLNSPAYLKAYNYEKLTLYNYVTYRFISMISISIIDVLNQNSHVQDRLESLTGIEEACSVKYLSNLLMLKNGKFYSARFIQFNHSLDLIYRLLY